MKKYHSRQNAPLLYREEAPITCVTRAKFWRKGLRIGNKVSLIENKFPFSEIDIHNKYDLEMANNAVKIINKNIKLRKVFNG